MQPLEALFESKVKLRLLKLFLHNPEERFLASEISKRTQIDSRSVRRELDLLKKAKLLNSRVAKVAEVRGISKKKKVASSATRRRGGKKKARRSQKLNYFYWLNSEFEFYSELKNLILKSTPASKDKIVAGIKKLGRVKLAVISGIFLNCENCRADLLMVGEINRKKFEKFIANLEAEVGKEINYAIMNTEEFNYRHNMFDRFIRSILEGPHQKIINRLKI